ncbi:hypothetical protein, partial [Parabacteroides sp.]
MRKGFKRKFFIFLSILKQIPFQDCILTGARVYYLGIGRYRKEKASISKQKQQKDKCYLKQISDNIFI